MAWKQFNQRKTSDLAVLLAFCLRAEKRTFFTTGDMLINTSKQYVKDMFGYCLKRVDYAHSGAIYG